MPVTTSYIQARRLPFLVTLPWPRMGTSSPSSSPSLSYSASACPVSSCGIPLALLGFLECGSVVICVVICLKSAFSISRVSTQAHLICFAPCHRSPVNTPWQFLWYWSPQMPTLHVPQSKSFHFLCLICVLSFFCHEWQQQPPNPRQLATVLIFFLSFVHDIYTNSSHFSEISPASSAITPLCRHMIFIVSHWPVN